MTTKTTVRRFDVASGIRERLALLAHFGPDGFNPHDWGYHSHRDEWYYCGPDKNRIGQKVRVSQEGAASLDILQTRHQMTRTEAMAWIGHPVILTVREDWKRHLTRHPQGEANARLIAAAPELFVRLARFVDYYSGSSACRDTDLRMELKGARALLARIDGEGA